MHGHGGVQEGCPGSVWAKIDRWQVGHPKLSLAYLNVELVGFELFRPSYSPLLSFDLQSSVLIKFLVKE